LNRNLRIALVLVLWLATLVALVLWLTGADQHRIALGGGPSGSESFALSSAIAETLNGNQSRFRIDVFETGGSSENLRLLEAGQLDLVEIQADTPVPEGVVGVARLYDDAYHLIVDAGAGIESFADLAGHRLAIPPVSSGQHASFWFLAGHYGLDAGAFIALPMAEEAANFAMIHGQVDAVFRVRSPGNAVIRRLIGDHAMRIVPIEQSEALALQQPAISAGIIPRGSYRGYPALPDTDLETAVLDRLLVTRADMDEQLIFGLTKAIFEEQRSELLERSKLAGFISPLGEDAANVVRTHPGARRYYDREKPTFLQENMRFASALLYTLVIIVTALLALRSRWQRMRRIHMGEFNHRLMALAAQVREETSQEVLVNCKHQLVDMLAEVVSDLDHERVNQEEFEHFSFAWQAVDALVRDRLLLVGMQTHPVSSSGVAA
jgi:TRAP transporter TAXI family solute receptor